MLTDDYVKQTLESGFCCYNIEFCDKGNFLLMGTKQGKVLASMRTDNLLSDIRGIDYYSFQKEYTPYKEKKIGGTGIYFSEGSYFENVNMPAFEKMLSVLELKNERFPNPYEFYKFLLQFEFDVIGSDGYGDIIMFKPWANSKKPERKGGILPSDTTIRPESVACRIMKIYPSFVREPELKQNLCKKSLERGMKAIFVRHTAWDIGRDADIFCKYNGKEFHISLYNDTPYGLKKRDEKIRNRNMRGVKSYCHINVPTRLSSLGNPRPNTIITDGGLELYSDEVAEKILKAIQNEQCGEFEI